MEIMEGLWLYELTFPLICIVSVPCLQETVCVLPRHASIVIALVRFLLLSIAILRFTFSKRVEDRK